MKNLCGKKRNIKKLKLSLTKKYTLTVKKQIHFCWLAGELMSRKG